LGGSAFWKAVDTQDRRCCRIARGEETFDLIGELLIAIRGLAQSEPTAHNWFAFALRQDVDYWRLVGVVEDGACYFRWFCVEMLAASFLGPPRK
jgi:hypothetical protein